MSAHSSKALRARHGASHAALSLPLWQVDTAGVPTEALIRAGCSGPSPQLVAPGRHMRQVPQQRLQLHTAQLIKVQPDSSLSWLHLFAHLLLLCDRLLGGCW